MDEIQMDDLQKVILHDDDQENGKTITKWRKWLITIIINFTQLNVTAASAIYTACYVAIEDTYDVSQEVAIVGLTTFVIGLAIAPLFLAPLSEFYGRKPMYLFSLTMFIIWQIPTAVARNIGTVLVSRFFAGATGSVFLTVSAGTISDIWPANEIALPMAVFSVTPFMGPILGPLIGGFIVEYQGNWRWCFWVIAIWGGTLLFAVVLLVPETLPALMAIKKARRIRKETGDESFKALREIEKPSQIQAIKMSCTVPFLLLVREPIVFLLCSWTSLLLAIVYLLFEAFPVVFGEIHGLSLSQVGLSYLGLIVGFLLAFATFPIWQHITKKLIAKNGGKPEPEFKLIQSIAGGPLAAIGLYWLAFTSFPSVSIYAPIVAGVPLAAGILFIFMSVFGYLQASYPTRAASALAANTFYRCMLAGGFPLFANQMYHKLSAVGASALLAGLLTLMAPLGLIFFIKGKQIRKMSKYAQASPEDDNNDQEKGKDEKYHDSSRPSIPPPDRRAASTNAITDDRSDETIRV